MITYYKQFRHYLLITLTSCFILGLILSFHFHFPYNLTLITFGICSFLVLSLALLRFNNGAIILLCFSFIVTGYWHGSQNINHPPPSTNISHFVGNGQEAVLVGTLARMVTGGRQGQRIIVESAFLRKKEHDLLKPVSGKVLLKLKEEWPETITAGDSFMVRTVFRKPFSAKSPGLFDYEKYLAEKQIYLIGTIRSPLLIHEIDSPLHTDFYTDSLYFVERIRTVIARYLSSTLAENHAALYQAVLLGDKSKISPGLLEAFKRSGVAHILAISGMHMALLGFFLFTLFYFLTRLSTRLILTINVRKFSMILCIGPLLLYSLLAGSNTPVTRSFIMSLMFIFGFCVNRPKSLLTILAAAALIILTIDPLSLKSASFQLSFAAVASIILITPILLSFIPSYQALSATQKLPRLLVRRTVELAVVTVSATIGTLPLLVYHFNQLSTVTLPANLIVEPLICFWALPCGFIALPLLFINPPLAKAVLIFGGWSLEIVTNYIVLISSIPMSVLWLPDISIFSIVLYYASFLLFISATSKQLRIVATIAFSAALMLFIIPASGLTSKFRKFDNVSFIDVGQGNSSLVQLAGGRTILIDTGAVTTPGFNCGERIVAPYLWSLGIGRVDDIILTHADADHYNGITALFERFRPLRLWLPGNQSGKPGYHSLISQARERGIKIEYPQAGVFITDQLSTLSRIGELPAEVGKVKSSDDPGTGNNDNSLIVSLITRNFSILFPGDISSTKESALIEEGRVLPHDILLSPHHGSSTSNSKAFLQAVNPRYLVVSAGASSNHLFPAPTTRATADKLGIALLTTRDDGTVRFTGGNGGFELKTSSDLD